MCVCVCVCFLPIHSGHQVRWTYQPGSHRRKVTQDFYCTNRDFEKYFKIITGILQQITTMYTPYDIKSIRK